MQTNAILQWIHFFKNGSTSPLLSHKRDLLISWKRNNFKTNMNWHKRFNEKFIQYDRSTMLRSSVRYVLAIGFSLVFGSFRLFWFEDLESPGDLYLAHLFDAPSTCSIQSQSHGTPRKQGIAAVQVRTTQTSLAIQCTRSLVFERIGRVAREQTLWQSYTACSLALCVLSHLKTKQDKPP